MNLEKFRHRIEASMGENEDTIMQEKKPVRMRAWFLLLWVRRKRSPRVDDVGHRYYPVRVCYLMTRPASATDSPREMGTPGGEETEIEATYRGSVSVCVGVFISMCTERLLLGCPGFSDCRSYAKAHHSGYGGGIVARNEASESAVWRAYQKKSKQLHRAKFLRKSVAAFWFFFCLSGWILFSHSE